MRELQSGFATAEIRTQKITQNYKKPKARIEKSYLERGFAKGQKFDDSENARERERERMAKKTIRKGIAVLGGTELLTFVLGCRERKF